MSNVYQWVFLTIPTCSSCKVRQASLKCVGKFTEVGIETSVRQFEYRYLCYKCAKVYMGVVDIDEED